MAQVADVDYILAECFLAVGQAVGPDKTVDFDAITWWHRRYRRAFNHAMTTTGTSWAASARSSTPAVAPLSTGRRRSAPRPRSSEAAR